ncbi:magnesium transporter MgtE N-terminal domain-containing protein [Terriglobus tenax]|uniref:magnesium transporter MgtE N-terminal domain-containing protein n=1 Tax=Terriglobus tenax TaxID=1111115 RepID=UPI0021DFA94A|nr:CBS domain-containing protein [Terriglobus tenax]
MHTPTQFRTSAAAMMGLPVKNAQGSVLGRIRDFAVDPAIDTGHVAGLLIRRSGKGRALGLVLVEALEHLESGELSLRAGAEVSPVGIEHDYLLLDRDLLDQQIIDIHGHKVVRVNDVDLSWERSVEGASPRLRIAEVEVGLRGALRRLMKGLPRPVVALSERASAKIIPWEFVDMIERDPARRVRLKIEQNRLAKMHPADIADILEELAPAEREAVFASLDEEIAAEALEEVDPKLQKALIEGLDSERVADIVEEMDPGAAADLLSELSDERSEAILGEMDPEERQEVEELLEFSEKSAAGRMTTEYVSVGSEATVADAIAALRIFEGDVATVTEIYLVDPEELFMGVVRLARLVLAEGDTPLKTLTENRLVFTSTDANAKHVAELFDKYNLHSLPVLDEEKKLVGIILAEEVISLLREDR